MNWSKEQLRDFDLYHQPIDVVALEKQALWDKQMVRDKRGDVLYFPHDMYVQRLVRMGLL